MNLTKVYGCYSKELRESCYEIKMFLNCKEATVDMMREFVKQIIEPAFIDFEAKKRFISNLDACETKDEINDLCHNAVVHGMNYKRRK